jgi:hypothetical protein
LAGHCRGSSRPREGASKKGLKGGLFFPRASRPSLLRRADLTDPWVLKHEEAVMRTMQLLAVVTAFAMCGAANAGQTNYNPPSNHRGGIEQRASEQSDSQRAYRFAAPAWSDDESFDEADSETREVPQTKTSRKTFDNNSNSNWSNSSDVGTNKNIENKNIENKSTNNKNTQDAQSSRRTFSYQEAPATTGTYYPQTFQPTQRNNRRTGATDPRFFHAEKKATGQY